MVIALSCHHSIKTVIINQKEFNLGKINKGDTALFSVILFNPSDRDTIKIKGISSSCSCAIVKPDSKNILPNNKVTLKGVFIRGELSNGFVERTISIHTDADTPFTFIKINAELL